MRPSATKESAYQNPREFCGALLGLILTRDLQVAGVLPQRPINLHWHEDNTFALSWSDNNRVECAVHRLRRSSWPTHGYVCVPSLISPGLPTQLGKPWEISTLYHAATNCSHFRSNFVALLVDRPHSTSCLFSEIDPPAPPKNVTDQPSHQLHGYPPTRGRYH